VDRLHELEQLRRRLAMLTPGTSGLTREQAMALVVELAEVQSRLERLRDGLAELLEESDVPKRPSTH
jgi:hypothetical protein